MSFRSLLYVPADNQKFTSKAHQYGADAIILDLEDAVAPANKIAAREGLINSVPQAGQSGTAVFVRINSDMKTGIADAISVASTGAQGIFVPKASVIDLKILDEKLCAYERKHQRTPLTIVALIENPKSLIEVEQIVQQERVIGVAVGGEDLAMALGAQPDADVLKLPKQLVHFAAKAHSVFSFGMFRSVANYSDLEAIKEGADEAKRYGFDGSSCVHPSAVPILNTAFQASDSDVLWAKQVVEEYSRSGGSISFQGKMIDAPVYKRALRILQSLDD